MPELLVVLLQAFLLLLLANRYLGRFFLWAFRKGEEHELDESYQPTVTVVIPLFNEGEEIRKTIRSVLEQDYSPDKLDVIVVDDCSTDGSYLHAYREAQGSPRVRVMRNSVNLGKRRAINRAVRATDAEIIVSVDSDVLVNPDAVRLLLRHFTTPDMAAVGGRVDISNKHDNWLTRMQSVKYFYSYYFTKGLEPAYKSVMCLSGCLTAYRRSVLLELEPILEERAVMGVPIKYGEDRFLTRHIVKAGYKTTMDLDAICKTKAVENLEDYFAQQLRWRRSNIVDYIGGFTHVWKQHPAVAIHYFSCMAGLLFYPTLITFSLLYGWFWPLIMAQVGLNAAMGVVYSFMSRSQPQQEKVSPLYILGLGFVTPVTYCLLVPVAFFTLDSGSWETRGHDEAVTEPNLSVVPSPVSESREPGLAPVIGISSGNRSRPFYAPTPRRHRKSSSRDRHRAISNHY
ncbi:MAG: glycosyltransferase family 2 protein [Deltaproteobacteria bacterium]|nr:glycosyltransferase family 2 protein [Deltaproteobacteria bacterium]